MLSPVTSPVMTRLRMTDDEGLPKRAYLPDSAPRVMSMVCPWPSKVPLKPSGSFSVISRSHVSLALVVNAPFLSLDTHTSHAFLLPMTKKPSSTGTSPQ